MDEPMILLFIGGGDKIGESHKRQLAVRAEVSEGKFPPDATSCVAHRRRPAEVSGPGKPATLLTDGGWLTKTTGC